jgi:hypothetical protein
MHAVLRTVLTRMISNIRVRSEVVTAAKMSMLVFWFVRLCGLEGR